MAFIQKVKGKKGPIYKVHYQEPLTGKRRCKNFARRKDAQKFLENPKVTGVHDAVNVTAGQAADHWIDVCRNIGRNGRPPVARSTIKPYERHARYFNAVEIKVDGQPVKLGDIFLERLTKAHCEALRKNLIQEFSWENARKHFTSFKSILTQARADDMMQHEPAEFVFIRPKTRKPGYDLTDNEKVPQIAEIRQLLCTMRKRVRISNRQLRRRRLRYNLIFKTMTFGGTRPGEALGLSWPNVDFKRGGLRIVQDVDDDGSIGELKSKASYRFISMPDHYMRQLKWWRKLCPASEHELVFPNWSGKVEFLSNLNRRGWQPLLIEAGLVDENGRHKYPPKSLRHARASLEIDSGANPKELQTLMGHSSIRVTFDVYGHLFEAHNERRQDRANQIASQLLAAE